MDMTWLGQLGFALPLGLGAIGSALGIGAAGSAAAGAWAKEAREGKQMNFLYIALTGMPLSQTIYGMILMFTMLGKAEAGYSFVALIGMGVVAGLAIAGSAWMQGRAGAGASDALAETGKGFTNYLAALGVIETVAIFVMVFIIIALG